MKIEAVLFDLGGTLLHYVEPQTTFMEASRQGLLAAHGFIRRARRSDLSADEFVRTVGQFVRTTNQQLEAQGYGASLDDTLQLALRQMNIELTPAEWTGALWCYYGVIQRLVSPVTGDARAVLQQLSDAGLRLGLVSNTWWSSALHDADLGRAGLLEYLPTRVYSSQAGFVKPRPEIFQQALAQMGCAASTAVYVGDRLLVDVAGAQAAGMTGVLVEVEHRREQSDEVQPAARLRQITDLPAVIAGWQ